MADGFTVTCLVDNTAALGSECWAEHGIAFLVESEHAKVLFDTGQSGELLAHNLSVLNKDLRDLSAMVLSHGHYDHTGGLERALSMSGDVTVHAHPTVFDERIARAVGKADRPVGIPFSREHLERQCRLDLSEEPVEVSQGVFTSGQIPRCAGPEPIDDRLLVRRGTHLATDSMLDDMSLVLRAPSGLVILTGCCHSGLVNTLEHVRTVFSSDIYAVLGGTHLARADNATLRESVGAAKARFGVKYAHVGHCSGARGICAFTIAFGEYGTPCSAGLSWTF